MAGWIITTVAGTGEKGFAGDGGAATAALLNGPFDIAFGGGGDLYFSDTFNQCVRRIDRGTGIITTVAGSGETGCSGDGGPAIAASLDEPYGIALDRAGNLYIADRLNKQVRRVAAATGIITTIAGPEQGFVEPNGLALDPAQTLLYVADVADHRVRTVDLASGRIATFAGTGKAEHSGDGGRAGEAGIFGARAVKVAADGTVFILERQGSSLRAVDPATGIIALVAGTGARGYAGDGGPALAAVFDAPKEMALDPSGDVLIVDTENHAIRRFDRSAGTVSALAGGRQGGEGDGGPAEHAGLDRPHGAVIGPDGTIYIGDTNNHRIRKVVRAER